MCKKYLPKVSCLKVGVPLLFEVLGNSAEELIC